MIRLLVAISHHGLGHLAQAAPLVNALHRRRPDLEFLVWSGLPHAALASRIHAPFQHRHEAADVGLTMNDAMHVDVEASRAAYLAFHRDWQARVAHEAAWLCAEGMVGVIADIAYLPLAAAAQARLAGVAMCSLNWVDIVHAYLAGRPGMAKVLEQMSEAYRSARVFLRLTPTMPMPWLDHLETLPPIAMRGIDRRSELRTLLDLRDEERLVLLGFGGIDYRANSPLPRLPGVRWLVPDNWTNGRRDVVPFSLTGFEFLDLFASADALVTKVGYGSFVEAAANGTPVIYIDRPDWPETPWLTDWLHRSTRAAAIAETELFAPELGGLLTRLWSMPSPPLPAVGGEETAAEHILGVLQACGE